MKIVYVYPQFTEPAGTERILIDKMNYLAERDEYEVFLLTNQQGRHSFVFPLSAKVQWLDFDVHFWELYRLNPFLRYLKNRTFKKQFSRRFSSFVADVKPDIVIASTFYSYIIDAVANCPFPYVRILESHIDKRFLYAGEFSNKKSLLKYIYLFYGRLKLTRLVPKYDILVTLNDQDSIDWSKYIRTIKIFNVVHLNQSGKYSNQQSKRIIFVGRYVKQKGIGDLIIIWKWIHYKHPDWHLDLYGSGNIGDVVSLEENYDSINIHFNQADDDIFKHYLESSLLLLTSHYEPFGLVMPEAMSCGLPVVAFDCPSGPSEIITDGVNGYLIKNRDKRLFAEKVCELIESPTLRLEMGQAAIESSFRFSEKNIMPKWEKLFSDLILNSKNENSLYF